MGRALSLILNLIMRRVHNPTFVSVEELLDGQDSVTLKINKDNASVGMVRRALGFDVMGLLWYHRGGNEIVQVIFEFEEDEDIEKFESLRGEADELEVEIKMSLDGVVLDVK